MIDDAALNAWFCSEVLPLEEALMRFIRRNWRIAEDVIELRQDIYERSLNGARVALPANARAFVFTVARNHLINHAKRARIVSFDLVADLESVGQADDLLSTERHLDARDQLRRASDGLNALPPRCREVVRMRKIEGLSTKEAAALLGIGTDTVERQLTMGMRALVDFMLGGSGKLQRDRFSRVRRIEES
jgi:RNA polymerase sigma-70 factor (ECF subfamily)